MCSHESLRSAAIVSGRVTCADCGKQWTDARYIGEGLAGSRVVVTEKDSPQPVAGKCWLANTLGGCNRGGPCHCEVFRKHYAQQGVDAA